jgi:hypothetical protein
MSPAEAATVLGVAVGCTPAEVVAAFKRRARQTHPDRFAGASAEELASAAAEFTRITAARDVLLAAPRIDPTPLDWTARVSRPLRRHRTAVIAWTAVMLLAIFISTFDAALPLSAADPIIRFGLLAVASVGFALTGRRILLTLTIVAMIATAVVTVVFTSFGSLLGLFLLVVPVAALVTIGWRLTAPVNLR